MMMNDPWGLLLNQRGGGSIDMSRGFSGLGNLPSLDWMPNPGAEHGVDVRGQFQWNVDDAYTFSLWYESVLFGRAREENRRLLLGSSAKTSSILLADNSHELPFDPVVAQGLSTGERKVVNDIVYELVVEANGFKVWRELNSLAPRSQDGQPTAPPTISLPAAPTTSSPLGTSLFIDELYRSLSWVPLSAPSASPIQPRWVPPASGLGADSLTPSRGQQPASVSLGDANVAPEWIFPAADRRLIQMVTGVETGNKPLNFVVNKVFMPWRNALAFAENIPLAAFMGIDDALKRSAVGVEYQAAQDMMPLAPAMGLEMEIGPALAYAKARISTSQRLRSVAKAPAYALMGMGVGTGVGTGEPAIPTLGPVLESVPSGERAIPTLGQELESALPSTELPSVAAGGGRRSPYGSYTNTHASEREYAGKGGPRRSQVSGRLKEKTYNDPHIATDWTPAESQSHQSFDEALRIFEEGGAGSKLNHNKIHTGRSIDPEMYNDFIEYILKQRE